MAGEDFLLTPTVRDTEYFEVETAKCGSYPGGERVAVGMLSQAAQIEVAKEAEDVPSATILLSGRRAVRMLDGRPWASGTDGFVVWWEKIGPRNRSLIGRAYFRWAMGSAQENEDFLDRARVVPAPTP